MIGMALVATFMSGWFLPLAHATDLVVGSAHTFSPSVKRYNGTTGAFIDTLVASDGVTQLSPLGGAFGPDDNLYVSSNGNESILRYNGQTGAFMNAFVSSGGGGLEHPAGLAFRNGLLYVADAASPGAVRRYNATTGAFVDAFVAPGSGGLSGPLGLAFGPDGNLYVTTGGGGPLRNGGGVLRFNGTTGAFIDTFVPTGTAALSLAFGVAFGPDGNLYVSNFALDFTGRPGDILRYNASTGALIDQFVAGGSGGLLNPRGLLFGPDGNLYVADARDSSVLRYNGTTGAFVDAFVAPHSGSLNSPTFLAFSPAAVPEPGTMALLVVGLCVLAIGLRQRKHRTTGSWISSVAVD